MGDMLRPEKRSREDDDLHASPQYHLVEHMSPEDIVAEVDSASRAQLEIQAKIQAMSSKLDDYFGSRDVCMTCRDVDLESFLQGEYLETLQDLMQEIIEEQYKKHKENFVGIAAQTNNKLDDISNFLKLFSECINNVNKDQSRQYFKLDEMQTLLSSIRQRMNVAESNTSSKILEQNEILQNGLKEVKTQLQALQASMLEHFGKQNEMMQTEKQEQTDNMTGLQDHLRDLKMQIKRDIETQNTEFSKEQKLRRHEESKTEQKLSHLEQGITRGFKDSHSEISNLITELNKYGFENYMMNNVLAKEQQMRQNTESGTEKRLRDLQDVITHGFQEKYSDISQLIREWMANHREDDRQDPAITTRRSSRPLSVKMCLRCQ